MIEIEVDEQEFKTWKKVIAYSPESLAYFTPKAKLREEKALLMLTREDIEDLLTILALLPEETEDDEDAYADFEDLLLFSINSSKEDYNEP